jgi:hypothetical protein
MSDPILDLLHEFRADVPEPDEQQRAEAFRHALDARGRTHGISHLHRLTLPRRPSRLLIVLGAAAALTTTAIVLVAPGHDGPGSPNQAQAATIVQRVIAAVSPPSGGVFHERFEVVGVPFAGAARIAHATFEVWHELGGSERFRTINEAIAPPTAIELATSADGKGISIFDPRTNGIYRLPLDQALEPLGPSSSVTGFSEIADTLRKQLNGGQLAEGFTVTRTKLAGKDVYRISNAQPSRAGPTGVTYYVDASSYVPVQVEEPGPPKTQPGGPRSKPGRGFMTGPHSPMSLTVTRILTYEHLDSTDATFDLQQAHPTATETPFTSLRPDVKARLVPLSGRTQPPSAASTGGAPPRLTVNPDDASIGSFHVGDKLLQLAPLLPAPMANFPVLPGNLKYAAAAGTFDRYGIFVVTFRDPAQEHSTSAYLNRPFKTARGDINSIGSDGTGTALDLFLSHWPEHGQPTATTTRHGTITTVTVGKATFYFSSDQCLSAVQLGDGDAAEYAGWGG